MCRFAGFERRSCVSELRIHYACCAICLSVAGIIRASIYLTLYFMKHQTLTPLGGHILIRRDLTREQMLHGVFIPEIAQERSQWAKVIAVGPGQRGKGGKIKPSELKVGDTILVSEHGGTEITLGEIPHVVVREENIFATIG